jgi:hypothetical protein
MLDAPTTRIADILAANLETVFANLCAQRYGGPISLVRVDDATPSASTVTFRLDRHDLPSLRSHFSVRHVGGNVYDVWGKIENGPGRSFTYCLPNDSSVATVPRAPHFAENVASFLLDAMERRLGSDLLRGNLRPSKAPERSSPAVPRTPSS